MAAAPKIDTGIRGLVKAINSIEGIKTIYSCDGHQRGEDLVFMGFDSLIFRRPVLENGPRSDRPAYVEFVPDADQAVAYAFLAYLADATRRVEYSKETPSYKFEIMAGNRAHIELPHEFGTATLSGEPVQVYRSTYDMKMRINFLEHLCEEFKKGNRAAISEIEDLNGNTYHHLEILKKYSPNKKVYPRL